MTRPTDEEIEAAAEAALLGRLIVLPTDTVYGIGTRPDDTAATARLFEAKRRPRDLELPVLVATMEEAEWVGRLGERARDIADRFWPGPVTIVVGRAPASAGWDLGGDPETIGLRIPRHPTALAVLERTGPLAVTSANLSGRPTPRDCREVGAQFHGVVASVLCDERALHGESSTVVDVSSGRARVLRRGRIPPEELLQGDRAR